MWERIGHRGAPSLATENTLPSFAAARDLGVDGVELDVQMSADGVAMVIHDATLDRTTAGSGAVAALTAAELEGWGVPRLRDVLTLLRGHCHVTCELKGPGTAGPTVEAVTELGMRAQVTLTSFELDRIAEARRLVPALRVGGISGSWSTELVDRLVALGAVVLDLYWGEVTPQRVADTAAAGVGLRVWTVNDPTALAQALESGVDGVMSDRPEWLLAETSAARPA